MFRRRILAAVAIGLGIQVAVAGAGGVDPRYPATIAVAIGGKPVRLALTGTALRTKYGFSVYTIGSYVREGVRVRDAEELARIAVAKQLHLIFEREVAGAKMAQSFRGSIAMSHPAPAFADPLAKLEHYFQSTSVRPGDHVRLTYLPGVGLECQSSGKPGVIIADVAFANAVWEVYLGRKNLGVAIKTGLTSRL